MSLYHQNDSESMTAYMLVQKSPVVMEGAEQAAQPGQSAISEQIAQPGQSAASEQIAQPEKMEHPGTVSALFHTSIVVWMIGTLLCFLYFAVSYIRSCRKFNQSLPVENEMLKEWCMAHRLRRKFSIRQADQISAPLTYGFFHPVILIPKTSDWGNKSQIRYILEHEYVHIQRCDAVLKLIIVLAVCIHWFNPLVWVMYLLCNRDIELSCDETVIRRFGEGTRASYAKLLVLMEEKKSSLIPFGSSFSKTAIEERITAIMKVKKRSLGMIVAAAVMVGGITSVFATSAAPDAQMENTQESGVQITDAQATETQESDAQTAKTQEPDTPSSDMIPYTPFTEKEYQQLLALRYDGYEQMSISEYQERVWTDTDTDAYRDLLERFSEDGSTLDLRDTNDIAGFLHYVLLPLSGEQWQSHDFSGGTRTDYPYPSDQACFEYVFTLTVTDAEQLTVGEYENARTRMYQNLNGVLESRTEEELQDEAGMETYLLEQIRRSVMQCETKGLQVTVDDWTYIPLVNIPEENEELEKLIFEQREAQWKEVLEPYLSLGVTYEYAPSADEFRMYYDGKEVKSITDEQTGIWISARQGKGVGLYGEDAVEMFAVYEDGKLVGLREADEQEEAIFSDQRDRASSIWEARLPYGTEEDYTSLLSLKTADYQKMTVKDFNARLLDWANEDYERMERINMDTSWDDWQAELSEDEKTFIVLTINVSGIENAELVRSIYTGSQQEDPILGEYVLGKSDEVNGRAAWCNLFYQFSYHIPDNSRITVGERDRCVGGMVDSVQAAWDGLDLDELLKMEKSDMIAILKQQAEEYSNELISISIDDQQVSFEKMDERDIC